MTFLTWRSNVFGVLIVTGCCYFLPTGLWSNEPAPTTLTSGQLKFEERLVWGEGKYVYGITATDIDGDKDLDLTTAGTHSDKLLWHENDGQGNLKSHTICQDDPGYLERHVLGDVNGDGHLDVVMVKNRVGHLLWFENSGTPADGKLWKRHVLTADFMRAYDVDLADLDGDGDLDVAASAYTGDCFAWFENPGKDKVTQPWTQYQFDKAPEIANTRTIVAVDINRDGKPDLLGTGTYGGHVVWYENTGKPGKQRFKRNIIDNKSPMPTHGHPVDMDGDGDVDVLMAYGMRGSPTPETHVVAWYENVGDKGVGTEWKKHLVGTLTYGFEAVPGDLDGDGDLDVIATGCSGGQKPKGELCWYENTGNAKGDWKKHPLKSYPEAAQVIVMDLDKDGRLDIAACSEAGTCYWFRNLGSNATTSVK